MFCDRTAWYKRKDESSDTWEVEINDYITHSVEVDCSSPFLLEEKIKDAMLKKGINPKKYQLKHQGGGWL